MLPIQPEMIRGCLKKHIQWLEEQVMGFNLSENRAVDMEDTKRQTEYCHCLLKHPFEQCKEEIEFMLIEYFSKM